jgi:outer membrane protein TolC
MSGDKSDTITFLKSSIDRYSEQLDELQQRLADGAGGLVERAQLQMQHEQIRSLIEDASRFLSVLTII